MSNLSKAIELLYYSVDYYCYLNVFFFWEILTGKPCKFIGKILTGKPCKFNGKITLVSG